MRRLLALRGTRLGVWLPLTGLIVLVGLTLSILGAQSVASTEAHEARSAFHATSQEIAASLKLSISHEEDLVVSTSAHVVTSPQAHTPTQFDRWIESVEAFRRYPELENIGFTVLVPASRLAAFKAQLAKDPIRPFGAHGVGAWEAGVLPNEPRPYYCLASAGMARSAEAFEPVGVNYCALAPTLTTDRDAGVANYAPITVAGRTTLGVATPVYRTGPAPATVAARRSAFVGWLGELIVPDVVIGRALEGHAHIAAKFSFKSPLAHVTFMHGRIPAGAMTDSLNVRKGWTLQAFAPSVSSLLFDNANARLRRWSRRRRASSRSRLRTTR
jgi:hypothetical protein